LQNPQGWATPEVLADRAAATRRIIYLKEEGCKFPSNVSPKIWENFSQANMEWALIKVAKELRAFGIVRTV
jgi:hypothetical protein